MVVCKFFQSGSCRFGTKCANEHFEVKPIVKSDVEAAISGKQWPLSCFGPFKDKPCIPNFIEDQSYEEIRLLCYESKRQNYYEAFKQQFNKEALEATNKLKALLQLTPDVIDVVMNVYDAPSDMSAAGVMGSAGAAAAGVAANNNSSLGAGNPFGLSATATAGNSLFSKPQTAAVGGGGGGNVFGGGFGNTAVSAIGSGGVIGGSIFGGGNNNTQQSSIFGQQTGAGTAAPTPTNSIFGSAQGSLFAPQQQQQQATGMNTSGGGLFAQAAQQMQAPPSGLFAQAASAFAPQSNNPFAQQQQQQLPSMGIFSQAAQAMQPAPVAMGGEGIFATAAAQSQNLFTQNQPNSAATTTNIFAQSQPQQQMPPTAFFQQAMQQQQPSQSAFMQQPQAAVQVAPASSSSALSTIYSRMEDLSAEDIEAFRADCFLPGKIPLMPPPRELIN